MGSNRVVEPTTRLMDDKTSSREIWFGLLSSSMVVASLPWNCLRSFSLIRREGTPSQAVPLFIDPLPPPLSIICVCCG